MNKHMFKSFNERKKGRKYFSSLFIKIYFLIFHNYFITFEQKKINEVGAGAGWLLFTKLERSGQLEQHERSEKRR